MRASSKATTYMQPLRMFALVHYVSSASLTTGAEASSSPQLEIQQGGHGAVARTNRGRQRAGMVPIITSARRAASDSVDWYRENHD
eukprot:2512272-Pleurochrysis_carterae.AAC.1